MQVYLGDECFEKPKASHPLYENFRWQAQTYTFLFAVILHYSHCKDQNCQTGTGKNKVRLAPERPAKQIVMTNISHFFSPFRK